MLKIAHDCERISLPHAWFGTIPGTETQTYASTPRPIDPCTDE